MVRRKNITATITFKPAEEQSAASKLAALRGLIDEGDESGVSERSVDDIMKAVIARKCANGTLGMGRMSVFVSD